MLSALERSTEQLEWDELQTVDWNDVPNRLQDPWSPRATSLECRWVPDEADTDRLISVWYLRPS
jgi:hypothetical protein